jgi:hypothetical protein
MRWNCQQRSNARATSTGHGRQTYETIVVESENGIFFFQQVTQNVYLLRNERRKSMIGGSLNSPVTAAVLLTWKSSEGVGFGV